MSAWFDDAVKAVLISLAPAAIAQINNRLEILTDPNSPAKLIEEGQKIIQLVDAWAKASEQLQPMPVSPLREMAQEEIDEIIQNLIEHQPRYIAARTIRRNQLFHLLAWLRLYGQRGWIGWLTSFLFYMAVIMTIQSVRLYLTSSWGINPGAIAVFATMAIIFWLLSWPSPA